MLSYIILLFALKMILCTYKFVLFLYKFYYIKMVKCKCCLKTYSKSKSSKNKVNVCEDCIKSNDMTIITSEAKKKYLLTDEDLENTKLTIINVSPRRLGNRKYNKYIISEIIKLSNGKMKKDESYSKKMSKRIEKDKVKKEQERKKLLKQNDIKNIEKNYILNSKDLNMCKLFDEYTESNIMTFDELLIKAKKIDDDIEILKQKKEIFFINVIDIIKKTINEEYLIKLFNDTPENISNFQNYISDSFWNDIKKYIKIKTDEDYFDIFDTKEVIVKSEYNLKIMSYFLIEFSKVYRKFNIENKLKLCGIHTNKYRSYAIKNLVREYIANDIDFISKKYKNIKTIENLVETIHEIWFYEKKTKYKKLVKYYSTKFKSKLEIKEEILMSLNKKTIEFAPNNVKLLYQQLIDKK